MKRILATAITLLCVACGDSSEDAAASGAVTGRAPPARGEGNARPEIVSAEIEPEGAWASQPMSLAIGANNPDRDRVKLEIEWYRNSELVPDLDRADVPTGSFPRGDRVYAIVYASDGQSEATHQTAAIIVANSPPAVRRVAITPARATALRLRQADVGARISPELTDWRTRLESTRVVGAPGDHCPLILDQQSRLYLFRYWEYERDLETFIKARALMDIQGIDLEILEQGLDRNFLQSFTARNQPDWQKIAARTALSRRFCVIIRGSQYRQDHHCRQNIGAAARAAWWTRPAHRPGGAHW